MARISIGPRALGKVSLFLLAGVLAFGGAAHAVTYTSVAAGAWNNPATWGGGGVPTASDDAVVRHAVTMTASGSARHVTIENGGLLTLNSSVSLSLFGDIVELSGGDTDFSLGTMSIAGSGPQRIAAPITALNIVVTNTAAVPSDVDSVYCTAPVVATNFLSVGSGQFMPCDGSSFGIVNLLTPGVMKPLPGARIAITSASGGTSFVANASLRFIHNNGTVEFRSAAAQGVTGQAQPFYDVVVNNSAAVPDDSNDVFLNYWPVANTLTVLDGQCMTLTTVHDVRILKDGVFKPASISITGDWYLEDGGTFLPSTTTINFTGSGRQVISGAPATFFNLSVNNTAATPSDIDAVVALTPVTATNFLTVSDGQFMPADGSSFGIVNMSSAAGLLKPVAGAKISVTSSAGGTSFFASAGGVFNANGGKVAFASAAAQGVGGFAQPFFDVEVNNTAVAPDDTNDANLGNWPVTGTLTATDGQCFYSGQTNNVRIGPLGILKTAGMSVSGNWHTEPEGTFLQQTSTVFFNGSGRQQLTGVPTTFFNLTINNSAAVPSDTDAVVSTVPVYATNVLTMTDGQFMPSDGSSFGILNLANANGLLKPIAGANITLTSATAGATFIANAAGVFNANGGKVTFASAAAQGVSGFTQSFFDVEVINTAVAPDDTNDVFLNNWPVTGTLTATDGQCFINGQSNHVHIRQQGVLKTGGLSVSGNWLADPAATFIPQASTVVFNGTGRQTIAGAPTTFYNVTINNSAAVPSDTDAVVSTVPVHATNILTVFDGQFMPSDGSSFGILNLANANGLLKPIAGANITLTSATGGATIFANAIGIFDANGGKVTFASAGAQGVSGFVQSFFNVEVNNTALVPDDSNDVSLGIWPVTGTLTATDGQCFVSGTVRNVRIAADGILKTGGMSVTGNWQMDAGGTFLPLSSQVNFNGSGRQTITGAPTSFYRLNINNSAPVPSDNDAVVAINPIVVQDSLLISNGWFMPCDGSRIGYATVNSTGRLKPIYGAEIFFLSTLPAQAIFAGAPNVIDANGSTFVFAAAGEQTTSGFSQTLANVRVINTAAVPGDTNDLSLTYNTTGTLTIEDGQCFLIGNPNNVHVGSEGVLKFANLQTTGNWSAAPGATVLPQLGTVTFNGSGRQTISGDAMAFYNLTIANTAPVPSDTDSVAVFSPITVQNLITVNDGQFMPGNGMTVAYLNNPLATGTIKPIAGATVYINGAIGTAFSAVAGNFFHNGSTLHFRQSGNVGVGALGNNFHNVVVEHLAAVPGDADDLAFYGNLIEGTLTLLDGQCELHSQVNDIVVGKDAILRQNAAVTVLGDFRAEPGAQLVNAGHAIVFSGSGRQEITAPNFAFGPVTVANTSAVPSDVDCVATVGPINCFGPLSINSGQFSPADGTIVSTVSMAGTAILRPQTAARMKITGPFGGGTALFVPPTASFSANGGTLEFTGSDAQDVNAAITAWNVEVRNQAAAPSTANDVDFFSPSFTVANALSVLDGQCSFAGTAHHVRIAAGGVYRNNGNVQITGNWQHDFGGSFVPGGFVTFAGLGPQTIDGDTDFGTLIVANAASPSDANAVYCATPIKATPGGLYMNSGQFMPANGSAFTAVVLNGGILKPQTGATVSLTGFVGANKAFRAFGGAFDPNGGTVRFAGNTQQEIDSDFAVAFHNVLVENDAPLTSSTIAVADTGAIDAAVMGTLTVAKGAATDFQRLNDVAIEAGGEWRLGANIVALSGDFANDGGSLVATSSTLVLDGGSFQDFHSTVPVAFADVNVQPTSTLNEIGFVDNFAVSGTLTIGGVVRRTRSLAFGPATYTGGLTGAAVRFNNLGTATELAIDRYGFVPNAAPEHVEPNSWTFDVFGGTGYNVDLRLPHNLPIPTQATVSRYLGTGTNWDFVGDSVTATTVTRNNITDLSSTWAVGDLVTARVLEWPSF